MGRFSHFGHRIRFGPGRGRHGRETTRGKVANDKTRRNVIARVEGLHVRNTGPDTAPVKMSPAAGSLINGGKDKMAFRVESDAGNDGGIIADGIPHAGDTA